MRELVELAQTHRVTSAVWELNDVAAESLTQARDDSVFACLPCACSQFDFDNHLSVICRNAPLYSSSATQAVQTDIAQDVNATFQFQRRDRLPLCSDLAFRFTDLEVNVNVFQDERQMFSSILVFT